jgi:hypothetical protein
MGSHKTIVITVLLIAALAVIAAGRNSTPAVQEPPSMPLGERLVYKIEWDPPWYLFFFPTMEAGEAELRLNGEVEHNGRKALQVVFKGRSSGTFAKMAGLKVEDEFIFLTEPGTLCTLSSLSKIREGKRKKLIDIEYMAEYRQLRIRETDESVNPPKLKKDETKNKIPECVHDPFSAIYLFRQSNLKEGFSQTFMLANDDKIREIKAQVDKRETIQGPSGKMEVWRVSPIAMMGTLFRESGQFKIWFSADEKKIPVSFEVKTGLGRVFGRLKNTIPPGNSLQ